MNARMHLLAVWFAVEAVAVGIIATYATHPASEFYNVSRDGLAGGLSRALVFTNYPVSLIGLAVIGVSLSYLLPRAETTRRAALIAVGIGGALLCVVTALPGVVEQADLDGEPVNAIPLAGVLIAIALSIMAMGTGEAGAALPLTWQDWVGRGTLAVLAVLALPWILAEAGVYIGDIPLLRSLYYSKQIPDGETLRAVHLGHHHGLDGLLFVFAAFTLGRIVRVRPGWRLIRAVAAYLGLMASYGIFNFANDGWLEQVVNRGWAAREVPDFFRPEFSIGWGLLLLGAIACWALFFRPSPAPLNSGESK